MDRTTSHRHGQDAQNQEIERVLSSKGITQRTRPNDDP